MAALPSLIMATIACCPTWRLLNFSRLLESTVFREMSWSALGPAICHSTFSAFFRFSCVILRKYFWLTCSLPWERARSDKSRWICLSKAVFSLTACKASAVNLYPSWSLSNTEGNCVSNVAHRRLKSPHSVSGEFSLLRPVPPSWFSSWTEAGDGALAPSSTHASASPPGTPLSPGTIASGSGGSQYWTWSVTRHPKTTASSLDIWSTVLGKTVQLFTVSKRLTFLHSFCITLRAFQKPQNQNLRFGKTGVSVS